jgi:hypothetical protein
MAARPAITSISRDFQSVIGFFAGRSLVPDNLTPMALSVGRDLHATTYSLLLWRFRLKGLRDCGRVFVQELASDALQILPQALMGYTKTTKLLTRGLIENALRHVYFADHPIEFQRMNADPKWYVPMSELREYALRHPLFEETEPRFPAVANLNRLYGELSGGVHGSRVDDLEMRVALNKIALSEAVLRAQTKSVRQTAESVNFLLATFHNLQFRRLQTEDRRAVLQTLTRRAKKALAEVS